MRIAHAAVTLLAALVLIPAGVVHAAPAADFAAPTDAWDALQDAKQDVRSAEKLWKEAEAKVVAASTALRDAELAVRDAESRQAAAEVAKSITDKDVSVLAREMYMTGGGTLGDGLELFALPTGVNIEQAVSMQAYLHSNSMHIVNQAKQADLAVAAAANDLRTANDQLVAAQATLDDAETVLADTRKSLTLKQAKLTATRQAVDEYLAGLPRTPVVADCTSPSSDSIAATIYSQAQGLGLGDVAALIGIGVGLGETGLQNDTDGDCWGGSCSNGRTSSRGVFQQFYSWPPSGMAWSGQDAPTGGTGTRFDQFNASNAWGAEGWARLDPRMDPAQAANMFFLGPNYGSSRGLEDNAMFQTLRETDVMDISPEQMVTVAQQVQQFPVRHMGSYRNNMTRAIDYFLRIKAGSVSVPPFRPPLQGMYRNATTSVTIGALKGQVPSVYVDDTNAVTAVKNDGVLIVGDSLAEGVSVLGGSPDYLYGGPVIKKHKVGIGTEAAITRWINDIRQGPSRVLVSLGSNDSGRYTESYAAQVDRLMRAAGPDREVYWYTLHYRPVNALNIILRSKEREHDNLTLIEVRDLFSAGSGYVSPSDNYLHPNSAGYEQMWVSFLNMDKQRSGLCPTR